MKIEGPMVDSLVGEIVELVSKAKDVLHETAKLVRILAEKKDLEFQVEHRRMPVTEEEIQKDITLSKKEIEIREREAAVRLLELQGREETAKAVRAEAAARLRASAAKQNAQRPTQSPVPASGRPRPFPPLKDLTKGEPVKPKSSEGLTHNLGEKLTATQAS